MLFYEDKVLLSGFIGIIFLFEEVADFDGKLGSYSMNHLVLKHVTCFLYFKVGIDWKKIQVSKKLQIRCFSEFKFCWSMIVKFIITLDNCWNNFFSPSVLLKIFLIKCAALMKDNCNRWIIVPWSLWYAKNI